MEYPAAAWWNWEEPYKISYREYVHNQAEKDYRERRIGEGGRLTVRSELTPSR